jgi:hypothetical protein
MTIELTGGESVPERHGYANKLGWREGLERATAEMRKEDLDR